MIEILARAGGFVAIILLGYILKRVGVFSQEDFGVLSKIVIRITLPAAIVTNFAGKQIDPAMLSIVGIGLGGGLLCIAAGYLTNLRSSRGWRAFSVLNLSGYNIGNFTLPFVQSFLGPVGVITTSLFDVGNSFICLGGAFGFATMVKDGSRFSILRILDALRKSVPFLTYLVMLTLNLLRISLPGPVLDFAQIIANSNVFVAMFMIGIGFRISGDRKQLGKIVKLLSLRYGIATVMALAIYSYLPFAEEVRQALVILCFAPISTAVPAFTAELGEDAGLSSAVNSISLVVSVVVIVALLGIML